MRRGVGSDGRGKAQRLCFQMGKLTIFVGGGGAGIAFIFKLGSQNQTLRPVDSVEIMTIKRRTEGIRLKWPGDGVGTSFFEGDFGQIFRQGGGRIEIAICNWAGKIDHTARLLTSMTLQSKSVRRGGGWNGWGMAWRFCEGERLQHRTSLMITRLWVITLSAMTPIWQRRP